MAKGKKHTKRAIRLFKISRELNVSKDRILEYLEDEGHELQGSGLNAKVSPGAYADILEAFSEDKEAVERHKERVRELRGEEADTEEAEADEAVGASSEDGQAAEETVDEETPGEMPGGDGVSGEVADQRSAVEEASEGSVAEETTAEAVGADDDEQVEDEDVPEGTVEPAAEGSVEGDEPVDSEAETVEADASDRTDTPAEEPSTAEEADGEKAAEEDVLRADRYRLDGPNVIGSVDEEDQEEEEIIEAPAADAAASAEADVEEAETDTETTQEAEDGDESLTPVATVDAEDLEIETIEAEEGGDEDDEEPEVLTARRYRGSGPKVVGSVDLKEQEQKRQRKRKRRRKSKVGSTDEGEVSIDEEQVKKAKKQQQKAKKEEDKKKKPRKRKRKKRKRKRKRDSGVDEDQIEQNIQETRERMKQGGARDRRRERRQQRRERHAERRRKREEKQQEEENVLELTEFVSAKELANLMEVEITDVIQTCMELGMMVSINQRLDADTITLIADEYGYEIDFISEQDYADVEIEQDSPEDLEPRAPVVTVMGHVDHGKTSLLDLIRRTNVVAGESGGITQHIGAYEVELDDDRAITFLDTPGHEAFTAMRARGAQVTDVVVLVVAADDAVMPQTIEAINHAQAAEVPIVVAINKMDKPEADAQRVMQQLADHNVLVEEYGGKVQASKVSAMTGDGVDDLLEKILLQAELLELQANPNREAVGTVVESRLEKGRGNVATVLVQNGTLRIGDTFVAGATSGRVRAMFDERDNSVEEAPPSTPVLVLGFDDSPDVGDQFVAMEEEAEAREIAQKRQQIKREQRLRQKRHVTLDEIGRRLALGDFQELNLVVKADVSGSVQALADALLELSTEEVQVNIIHSGVGAITESDVLLASASDAVIIGFQVRPMPGVRKLAEREEIDIRTYSVIYDAVEEVRVALEGLLAPEKSEEVNGVAEVREIFKVPKVGTVGGAYVLEGKIMRNDKIRVIRDGVVIYDGEISSLKRFQEDVKEVATGYECGISIDGYNDLKVEDHLEAYEVVETKRTLNV
jgi:translation initiation factor IF-2